MGKANRSSESAVDPSGLKDDVGDPLHGDPLEKEPASIRLAVKLPPKQRIALDALGANCGVPEAARLAGVDRTTVSRWLNHDVKFIAAYNAMILDNIKTSRAEMAALLPLASAALRKALEKGNGWLALQFIREARALGVLDPGPTSVQAVKEEMKLARQIHEAELMKKQVEVEQKLEEIERLRHRLDQRDDEKAIAEAKAEGYWYAMTAFYQRWRKEQDEKQRPAQPEPARQLSPEELAAREERAMEHRAEMELTDEKYRQLADDVQRLQQHDQQKRQSGQRVKSPMQQAHDLHDRAVRLDKQHAKERETLRKQQAHAQHVEQQHPAAEQQPSNDEQPAPDSLRPDEPHEAIEQDAKQHNDAERRTLGDDHPAAPQRPADDSTKSNPDVESTNSRTLAADESSDSPRGPASDPDDPTDRTQPNDARENELNEA